MKPETTALLKAHNDAGKFKITPQDNGDLAFDYDLTDDEVKEVVVAEYGPSLTAPVEQLFEAVVRKMLKLAGEHAKSTSDKLSDL